MSPWGYLVLIGFPVFVAFSVLFSSFSVSEVAYGDSLLKQKQNTVHELALRVNSTNEEMRRAFRGHLDNLLDKAGDHATGRDDSGRAEQGRRWVNTMLKYNTLKGTYGGLFPEKPEPLINIADPEYRDLNILWRALQARIAVLQDRAKTFGLFSHDAGLSESGPESGYGVALSEILARQKNLANEFEGGKTVERIFLVTDRVLSQLATLAKGAEGFEWGSGLTLLIAVLPDAIALTMLGVLVLVRKERSANLDLHHEIMLTCKQAALTAKLRKAKDALYREQDEMFAREHAQHVAKEKLQEELLRDDDGSPR